MTAMNPIRVASLDQMEKVTQRRYLMKRLSEPKKVLIKLKCIPISYEDKIKVIRNTLIPTWFTMNRYLISSTFVITILYTLHVTVMYNHLTYKTSHNLCSSNQTPTWRWSQGWTYPNSNTTILYSKRNVVDEHPILFLIFSWVFLFNRF